MIRQGIINRLIGLQEEFFDLCESWGIPEIRTSERSLNILVNSRGYKKLNPSTQQVTYSVCTLISHYLTEATESKKPPTDEQIQKVKQQLESLKPYQ